MLHLASRAFASLTRLRRSLRGAERVPGITVISVGGLRLGGVGKSPVAREISVLLGQRESVIVMRGYGGRAPGPRRVRPHDSPELVGDEALEHLGLGHAVIVSRDRVAGVRLARAEGFKTAVLDDGFQHVALARDLDVVLLARDDLTARVLPAGPLREPLSALAHAAVLASLDPTLTLWEGRAVHPVSCALVGLRDGFGRARSIDEFAGARALVVTAIARPERVVRDLAAAGVTVVEHRALRDHRRFAADALRPSQPVDLVVVTGKDAARGALALPCPAPLYATAQRTTLPEAMCQQLRAELLQRQVTTR